MSLLATLLLPTIWIVDANGGPGAHFPDLPPAVAAAVDGDTILVRAGSYSPLVVTNKALAIRGAGAAVTHVAGAVVNGAPAGLYVLLAGMDFVPTAGSNLPGLIVYGPGSVLANDCTARGDGGQIGRSGLYLSTNGLVSATRCAFTGGDCTAVGAGYTTAGRGADVLFGGRLVATDCLFVGGASAHNPQGLPIGGDGVSVYGAAAVFSGTNVHGGDAGSGLFGAAGYGGTALRAGNGSTVRVEGGIACLLQGGIVLGPSGPTIVNPGAAIDCAASTVHVHADVALVAATIGAPLVTGTGVTSLNEPPAPRLHVTGTALASGETDSAQLVTVSYTGLVPGAPFFFLVGFLPDLSSAIAPDLRIDLSLAVPLFGVLDAAGGFAFSFVPAQLVGITGLPFLGQAGTFDPLLGLRTSNVDVRVYGP